MRHALLTACLLAFGVQAISQTITIKKVELAGEMIHVHYELDDSNPNNEYLLHLYSSRDNYATPLTNVTGHVGAEIKPGSDKKISWNVIKEYGGYKGKMALEIRGKVFVPFVKLQGFDPAKTYKRGKSYPLTWKVGGSNPINIELYKGSQRVGGDVNHPNNGGYTLFIPAQAKPGKDYRLKISDSRNTDEVIYTTHFSVKPKIPLLLKAAPVVVVGALAAILLGGPDDPDKDEKKTGTIEDPEFPGN